MLQTISGTENIDLRLEFIEARTGRHYNDTHSLFIEYQKHIGIDLCFQDFQTELDELPGKYAAPGGCIILVYDRQKCIGCVALRPISDNTCEMKRLFVRPEYQGISIGKKLSKRIIRKAVEIGYSKMRLDTLDTMKSAINIYKQAGFKEIAPYYHNPLKNVIYFECDLKKISTV